MAFGRLTNSVITVGHWLKRTYLLNYRMRQLWKMQYVQNILFTINVSVRYMLYVRCVYVIVFEINGIFFPPFHFISNYPL